MEKKKIDPELARKHADEMAEQARRMKQNAATLRSKKKSREDVNQAAARIVREATED
ncbi:MAG TPA: hypothetical protein VGL89_12260 [Candidatus Koribacter sp.]|jgi:hypothetical protein